MRGGMVTFSLAAATRESLLSFDFIPSADKDWLAVLQRGLLDLSMALLVRKFQLLYATRAAICKITNPGHLHLRPGHF